MNRITKTVLSVAVTAAVVVGSGSLVYKNVNAANDGEQSTVGTTAQSSTTVTTTETTTSSTTTTTTEEVTVKKTSTAASTKAATTKFSKQEVLKNSKILAGKKAVRTWKVNSNGIKVTAEKLKLNLNVYKDGKKTSETVTRYAYVAVVKADSSKLNMISAKQATGKMLDTLPHIANAVNPVFAANGEMCSHDKELNTVFFNSANDTVKGTVIKDGKVAQSMESTPSLAMSKDGTWSYPVYVAPSTTDALMANGIKNTVGYTYPVIWDGEPYYIEDGSVLAPLWHDHNTKLSNPEKHFYNDQIMTGQIDKDTYVVIIGEGFGHGYLCELMTEMGVQNAYWGNGGHCASIYIKGYGVINRENDTKPCSAADMLYFK